MLADWHHKKPSSVQAVHVICGDWNLHIITWKEVVIISSQAAHLEKLGSALYGTRLSYCSTPSMKLKQDPAIAI